MKRALLILSLFVSYSLFATNFGCCNDEKCPNKMFSKFAGKTIKCGEYSYKFPRIELHGDYIVFTEFDPCFVEDKDEFLKGFIENKFIEFKCDVVIYSDDLIVFKINNS